MKLMKKIVMLSLLVMSQPALANDITFKFKNPSFSGDGTGAYWLTIENQQFNRRRDIEKKIEDELRAAAAEEKNSFLNRFLNNLQSRVYSRLAAQLTDNLFSSRATEGTLELEGSLITYRQDDDKLTLTIRQPDGSVTEITIPLSGFSF
jgi:hypothetical protein